ncbi:MAG: phospholipid-binding protein, partial [Planctomycetota bacterium]|nr:phospholipid-binding protein [Planctomycetota bacterium]
MHTSPARSLPLALTLLLALPAALASHPPGPHAEHATHSDSARTWTDPQTGRPVTGSFLSARDGHVSIECEDGTVATWHLEDL